MLENNKVDGIHYSRIIASWYNSGGYRNRFDLEDWLLHLKEEGVLPSLTESDITNITEMATCGKMELEHDAKRFIENELKDLESRKKRRLFRRKRAE